MLKEYSAMQKTASKNDADRDQTTLSLTLRNSWVGFVLLLDLLQPLAMLSDFFNAQVTVTVRFVRFQCYVLTNSCEFHS